MAFFLVADEETGLQPGVLLPGLEEPIGQLRAMLHQERKHYSSCPDYLKAGEIFNDPLNVNTKWRLKICEWIFEVVDHFGFDRDVAAIALDYLDRSVAASFESAGKPVTKREYQLYAVTSLYIAVKLHGETDEDDDNEESDSNHESSSSSRDEEQQTQKKQGCRKKLRITAYQELSRGFFTVETIEMMERRILSLLKWRMNPPTATQFVLLLLRFLPRWSTDQSIHSFATVVTKVYDISRYLTELSCCDASFSFESSPSFVAYASLLNAFDAIRDTTPIPDEVVAKFLCNVAVASEVLLPGLEQTRVLQRKLRDLAPALFPVNQPTLARSVSFEDGESMEKAAAAEDAASSSRLSSSASSPTTESSVETDSPICFYAIKEENENNASTGRKRSRNEYETCMV